jgi:hypothetical protein
MQNSHIICVRGETYGAFLTGIGHNISNSVVLKKIFWIRLMEVMKCMGERNPTVKAHEHAKKLPLDAYSVELWMRRRQREG